MSDKEEYTYKFESPTGKTYKQMFDECYNTGVYHCIEVVKEIRLPENGFTTLDDFKKLISIKLEQLKKPLQP